MGKAAAVALRKMQEACPDILVSVKGPHLYIVSAPGSERFEIDLTLSRQEAIGLKHKLQRALKTWPSPKEG